MAKKKKKNHAILPLEILPFQKGFNMIDIYQKFYKLKEEKMGHCVWNATTYFLKQFFFIYLRILKDVFKCTKTNTMN